MRAATVIERTSKRWKGMRLGGCLSVIVGLLFLYAWDAPVFGFVLLAFGIVAYVGSRVGAWWHHG